MYLTKLFPSVARFFLRGENFEAKQEKISNFFEVNLLGGISLTVIMTIFYVKFKLLQNFICVIK